MDLEIERQRLQFEMQKLQEEKQEREREKLEKVLPAPRMSRSSLTPPHRFEDTLIKTLAMQEVPSLTSLSCWTTSENGS
jgi:hypothetical protein